MAETSRIEWTDHTWNPWIGCTRVSAACDHCYAASMSHRRGWAEFLPGAPRHRTSADYWRQPHRWNRKAAANGVRARVFPSLCDPFDAEVDEAWRVDLYELILATPWLEWLLLTKRPQVANKFFTLARPVPPNVSLGTTAENKPMASLRIPQLLGIDAPRHFVSMEPLLEGFDLADLDYGGWSFDALRGICHHATTTYFKGIDWVIAGGESGPGARPPHPLWFAELRDQCAAAGVPFFFKQWGDWAPGSRLLTDDDRTALIGYSGQWMTGREYEHRGSFLPERAAYMRRIGKTRAGAVLDGREHRELPRHFQAAA